MDITKIISVYQNNNIYGIESQNISNINEAIGRLLYFQENQKKEGIAVLISSNHIITPIVNVMSLQTKQLSLKDSFVFQTFYGQYIGIKELYFEKKWFYEDECSTYCCYAVMELEEHITNNINHSGIIYIKNYESQNIIIPFDKSGIQILNKYQLDASNKLLIFNQQAIQYKNQQIPIFVNDPQLNICLIGFAQQTNNNNITYLFNKDSINKVHSWLNGINSNLTLDFENEPQSNTESVKSREIKDNKGEQAHNGCILALCFLQDHYIASCSEDNQIKVWNYKNGKLKKIFKTDKPCKIILSLGNYLIGIEGDMMIIIDWKNKKVENISTHMENIQIAQNLNENEILLIDFYNKLYIYKFAVSTKQFQINYQLTNFEIDYQDNVKCCLQKQNKQEIILTTEKAQIQILNYAKNQIVTKFYLEQGTSINCFVTHPNDENILIIASNDGVLTILDTKKNLNIKKIVVQKNSIKCLQVLNQDQILIGNNNECQIFSIDNYVIQSNQTNYHKKDINCILRTQNNQFLTADIEGKMRLWQIQNTKSNYQSNQSYTESIESSINLQKQEYRSIGQSSIIQLNKNNQNQDIIISKNDENNTQELQQTASNSTQLEQKSNQIITTHLVEKSKDNQTELNKNNEKKAKRQLQTNSDNKIQQKDTEKKQPETQINVQKLAKDNQEVQQKKMQAQAQKATVENKIQQNQSQSSILEQEQNITFKQQNNDIYEQISYQKNQKKHKIEQLNKGIVSEHQQHCNIQNQQSSIQNQDIENSIKCSSESQAKLQLKEPFLNQLLLNDQLKNSIFNVSDACIEKVDNCNANAQKSPKNFGFDENMNEHIYIENTFCRSFQSDLHQMQIKNEGEISLTSEYYLQQLHQNLDKKDLQIKNNQHFQNQAIMYLNTVTALHSQLQSSKQTQEQQNLKIEAYKIEISNLQNEKKEQESNISNYLNQIIFLNNQIDSKNTALQHMQQENSTLNKEVDNYKYELNKCQYQMKQFNNLIEKEKLQKNNLELKEELIILLKSEIKKVTNLNNELLLQRQIQVNQLELKKTHQRNNKSTDNQAANAKIKRTQNEILESQSVFQPDQTAQEAKYVSLSPLNDHNYSQVKNESSQLSQNNIFDNLFERLNFKYSQTNLNNFVSNKTVKNNCSFLQQKIQNAQTKNQFRENLSKSPQNNNKITRQSSKMFVNYQQKQSKNCLKL